MNTGLMKGLVTVGLCMTAVGVASSLALYASYYAIDYVVDRFKGKRPKKSEIEATIKELDNLMSNLDKKTKNERVIVGGIEFKKSN